MMTATVSGTNQSASVTQEIFVNKGDVITVRATVSGSPASSFQP